ncbi:MAG: transcription elongation factor subunit Spt4 [Candidatus Pacearchaeota archaeon]
MKKGKKACKKCKALVESGDKCPLCQSTQLVDSWKGQVVILKPEESEIAKEIGIKQKGTYAIKI